MLFCILYFYIDIDNTHGSNNAALAVYELLKAYAVINSWLNVVCEPNILFHWLIDKNSVLFAPAGVYHLGNFHL